MKLGPASIALTAVAVACGAKPPPAPAPTAPTATPTLPDVPFAKLDPEQRARFMTEQVVPAMAPIFRGHDATRYRAFGCQTCHGVEASAGRFAMPNPALPRLVIKELAGGTKYRADDLDWMARHVAPTMAGLLQRPAWSPENQNGFGCNACHVMDE